MDAKVFQYLSPFIAAALASWLTYFFAVRQHKHAILIKEKLAAFKVVQERLVAIRRYCEAGIAEIEGGDFNPTFEALPDTDARSALLHSAALRYVIDANRIWLSDEEIKALNDLSAQMGMLCSMELAISADPSLKETGVSGYSAAIREVDTCINTMRDELNLPR
jgi:hypothetical protein